MNIKIWLSGFLFLLILVLQIAMAIFGYILEPTPKHYESDDKLQKFNKNPRKFKIGFGLALIEHFCVITLAIMLFFVISLYNILFGTILLVFRVAEGAIQVYIEKDYWKLLNIANEYSITSGMEKESLMDSYRGILKTKSNRFTFAMIGWSVGTLAFSIVLVTFGLVPLFIGWMGIVAGILIGFANGMNLVKPDVKAYEALSSISGLLAILFELLIGSWLLFFGING
ncbi:MAG: DUF4386 domain-containing protein [Promethearchaeota archaeon]